MSWLEFSAPVSVALAVLPPAGLLKKFWWPIRNDEQAARQRMLLTKVAEIVIPNLMIDAITADDDDNRILEGAVAGKGDLIVSGDHHLLDLKSYRNIGIIRPVDFHRTLPGPPGL
jgi:predicted nucleic acid-binding protein